MRWVIRGRRIGTAGSLLGLLAGVVQWAVGDEVPAWTGNNLHPVQLGLITIALSLPALAMVRYLAAPRARSTFGRAGATLVSPRSAAARGGRSAERQGAGR